MFTSNRLLAKVNTWNPAMLAPAALIISSLFIPLITLGKLLGPLYLGI